MKVIIYTHFDDMPSHYGRLLVEFEHTNIYCGRGWFRNFFKNTLEPDAQPRIYAVEDQDSTPLAILFMRAPAGQNGSILKDQHLSMQTLASMTNFQSVIFAPVAMNSPAVTEEALSLLVKTICSETPSWAVIDINLMVPDSVEFTVFKDALKNCGMLVNTYRYEAILYREFEKNSSYDAFISQSPSIIRKTYQKKTRQLNKKGDVRFEIISEPSDLDRGMELYEKVFAKSWKDAEPYPNHTAGLVREYASIGALRLAVLFFNEEPVAVHIWIVSEGCARGYKMHYDLEFERLSVGAILQLKMFKHFLDVEHVKEINYGLGTQNTKRSWVPHEYPLHGILACNPKTLLGLKTQSLHSLKKLNKSLRQSLQPLTQLILRKLKR